MSLIQRVRESSVTMTSGQIACISSSLVTTRPAFSSSKTKVSKDLGLSWIGRSAVERSMRSRSRQNAENRSSVCDIAGARDQGGAVQNSFRLQALRSRRGGGCSGQFQLDFSPISGIEP